MKAETADGVAVTGARTAGEVVLELGWRRRLVIRNRQPVKGGLRVAVDLVTRR